MMMKTKYLVRSVPRTALLFDSLEKAEADAKVKLDHLQRENAMQRSMVLICKVVGEVKLSEPEVIWERYGDDDK
jgi:hypothetical protein